MKEHIQMKQSDTGPRQRVEWLDVCKGILIFFVILSHSYPTELYEQFFTPFFLTMFFFASGYTFSTKSNFKEFIKNKCIRLLIPFLVLGLSRVAMYYVIEGGDIAARLKGFALQINGQYDELWFVSCLFTSSVLFYFIVALCRKQKRFSEERLVLVISSVVSIIGFADICVWKIRLIWEFETACMMLIYMAIGYWYRRREKTGSLKFEKAAFMIPLFVLYTCIVLLFKNNVNIHTQTFEVPLLFVFSSLVVIFPIVYISKQICHSFMKSALVFMGKNTLFYYAYAGIIRVLFYACCNYLSIENEWILPILCALFSALFMAFPAWLVRKYLPWIVGGGSSKPANR